MRGARLDQGVGHGQCINEAAADRLHIEHRAACNAQLVLQQGGRYETLMLDGFEYTKIAQANAGLGRADEQGAEETMDALFPYVLHLFRVAKGMRHDEK